MNGPGSIGPPDSSQRIEPAQVPQAEGPRQATTLAPSTKGRGTDPVGISSDAWEFSRMHYRFSDDQVRPEPEVPQELRNLYPRTMVSSDEDVAQPGD